MLRIPSFAAAEEVLPHDDLLSTFRRAKSIAAPH
jgi:hypothetical protein